MKVTHNKTGRDYYIDDVIIDTTNDLEPEEACKVLYHDLQGKRFVREAHEFFEKFNIEEGFNVLNKACWGMIEAIKDYELKKKQAVESEKAPTTAKIKTYVRVDDFYDEDGSISHSRPEGILDKQEMDELIRKHTENSCSCESNGNNDFKSKRIDLEVYESYKQIKPIKEEIPVWVIKQEAMEILRDLFTIRCNKFEVEEKQYDNSTNEFFLIGKKEYPDCCSTQVVQISKDLYHKIIIEYHGWVNQIVGEESEDDQYFNK